MDTVALGCSDGKVRVHNIRRDCVLFELTHSESEAVTAVAFRTGERRREEMGRGVGREGGEEEEKSRVKRVVVEVIMREVENVGGQ